MNELVAVSKSREREARRVQEKGKLAGKRWTLQASGDVLLQSVVSAGLFFKRVGCDQGTVIASAFFDGKEVSARFGFGLYFDFLFG